MYGAETVANGKFGVAKTENLLFLIFLEFKKVKHNSYFK